jgi:hypothetical protein
LRRIGRFAEVLDHDFVGLDRASSDPAVFAVAYVVLAISTVFDQVSLRRSAGQMSLGAPRRYLIRIIGSAIPQGVAAVLIALMMIRQSAAYPTQPRLSGRRLSMAAG